MSEKKRKKKKTADREPSKNFSENTFDTRGSIGSPAAQAGRDVNIDQHINITQPEQKPIKVPPKGYESNLIWFGKKIMMFLFGSLVHSMVGYTIVTSGLSAGAFALAYVAIYRNPLTPGTQVYSFSQVGSLLVAAGVVYLGPLLVKVSRETQCPFCGARFSYGMIDSLLLNDRKLASGRIIENYENTYGCEVCKKTKRVRETKEIEPAPSDDDSTD